MEGSLWLALSIGITPRITPATAAAQSARTPSAMRATLRPPRSGSGRSEPAFGRAGAWGTSLGATAPPAIACGDVACCSSWPASSSEACLGFQEACAGGMGCVRSCASPGVSPAAISSAAISFASAMAERSAPHCGQKRVPGLILAPQLVQNILSPRLGLVSNVAQDRCKQQPECYMECVENTGSSTHSTTSFAPGSVPSACALSVAGTSIRRWLDEPQKRRDMS